MTRVAALVLLAAGFAADGAHAGPVEPVRQSALIHGGRRAIVEIRDQTGAAARQMIRAALVEMDDVLRDLDAASPGSAVARLNAAAGDGPRLTDGNLVATLARIQGFCTWSQNAHGPLGAPLYELWRNAAMPPSGEAVQQARRLALCQNLQVRQETLQTSLTAGARLDLASSAEGLAADRAAERLRQGGTGNAWIELESVVRAIGPGADGLGWIYRPPVVAGMSEALEAVRIVDGSLAMVSAHRGRFRFGESSYSPFLDQRTGRPASGVVAVLVATERALDAQTLAVSLLVLGNREGQLRLGNVTPAPSALWLLGDGSGEPLLSAYNWSAIGASQRP